MLNERFAILACSALATGLYGTAGAQEVDVTADGCAELARAVYDEVAAAAVAGPQRSGPWVIGRHFQGVSVCRSATKTVSGAFRLAMASVGVEVRWSDEPMDPGDYCLSGFLAQCYPRRVTMTSGSSNPNALMVHQAWSVVSQAVMRTMANPYSSNEVRFDPDQLRLQLGLVLRTIERPR